MISTFIAIAMPPIPEGDILCCSVLFSCLGIPSEAIIPATAIGVVLDYLDTGVNTLLLIFHFVCDAQRFDELDRTVLLKNE